MKEKPTFKGWHNVPKGFVTRTSAKRDHGIIIPYEREPDAFIQGEVGLGPVTTFSLFDLSKIDTTPTVPHVEKVKFQYYFAHEIIAGDIVTRTKPDSARKIKLQCQGRMKGRLYLTRQTQVADKERGTPDVFEGGTVLIPLGFQLIFIRHQPIKPSEK